MQLDQPCFTLREMSIIVTEKEELPLIIPNRATRQLPFTFHRGTPDMHGIESGVISFSLHI